MSTALSAGRGALPPVQELHSHKDQLDGKTSGGCRRPGNRLDSVFLEFSADFDSLWVRSTWIWRRIDGLAAAPGVAADGDCVPWYSPLPNVWWRNNPPGTGVPWDLMDFYWCVFGKPTLPVYVRAKRSTSELIYTISGAAERARVKRQYLVQNWWLSPTFVYKLC